MNEEIWKIIEEAPSYEVSNQGKVRNIKTKRILKGSFDKDGYRKVTLSVNKKMITRYIHRLVAIAFLPNECGFPCVNHIDEIKDHNEVENLEWCTHKYNVNYGKGAEHRRQSMAQTNIKRAGRPAKQGIMTYAYDAETLELIGIYPSIRAAAETLNCNYSTVAQMIKGKSFRQTHHGYIFKGTPLQELDN